MKKSPDYLGGGSIINAPARPLMGYLSNNKKVEDSNFGKNVWIGANCVVGKNVTFQDNVTLSDGSNVEDNVFIGKNTLLVYKCLVCANVVIKEKCIIGGFIGENSKIGHNCRIFGDIVHNHIDPTKDWDAPESLEEGATISNNVFIGFGAKITKPINIQNNVYICPNSVVSTDVPAFHIVKGINEIIHYSEWKGELRVSNFFKT